MFQNPLLFYVNNNISKYPVKDYAFKTHISMLTFGFNLYYLFSNFEIFP